MDSLYYGRYVTCISHISVMAPDEANWNPIKCSYTVLTATDNRVYYHKQSELIREKTY
jgi:hypothetical protein